MSASHVLSIGSRNLAVRVDRSEEPDQEVGPEIVITLDDIELSRTVQNPLVTTVKLPAEADVLNLAGLDIAGAQLVVRSLRRGSIGSCQLVVRRGPGRPERLLFEPPTNGWTRRRYDFEQRHPRIFAARHVIVAVCQVVVAVIGINIALNLALRLSIPLPDLPRPNLPDIPWPDVDLPDWSLPGWLRSILESKKYWFPILVALFIAWREAERRQKRRENQAKPKTSDELQRDDGQAG